MGWLRSLAAVVACGVLLAGCSDDGPDGDPSPSPSVSTTAPASPTPTAAPAKEPALPTAAKEPTEAGARAFIAYYWDLINYAQVTGDVKALERVSGPSCDGCRGGIDAIDAVYQNGGHAEGGAYTAVVESLQRTKFSSRGALAFDGLVRVQNERQVISRADGTSHTLAPTQNSIKIYLLWVRSSWRMDVLVVR